MILERHSEYGKYIDFDPVNGHWRPAGVQVEPGAQVNGVGDLVGDSCVALVRHLDRLEVYVGQIRFDVQDPRFTMSYEHLADSRTAFRVRDSQHSAEILYPSWWVASQTQHLAFGTSPDEDEDICAYLVYMLNGPAIRAAMVDSFVSR